MCIRNCGSRLGHHSCIVWSLVLVGNTRGVAWLWWYCRWCQTVLCLVGDRTYDAICGMGCSRCVPVGGACIGRIWNDSVKVSILCIDHIKLLGFQDSSSSDWGRSDATSFAIGGSKVLRNQSLKILSSSWILHRLRHRRHSWMWSVIWVAVFWWQDNKISTPSLYLTRIWKYCKNMKAKELKSRYLACGSSMYHFDAAPMRVHWNN